MPDAEDSILLKVRRLLATERRTLVRRKGICNQRAPQQTIATACAALACLDTIFHVADAAAALGTRAAHARTQTAELLLRIEPAGNAHRRRTAHARAAHQQTKMTRLDVVASLFERLRQCDVHANSLAGLAIFKYLQKLRRLRQRHQQQFGGHNTRAAFLPVGRSHSSETPLQRTCHEANRAQVRIGQATGDRCEGPSRSTKLFPMRELYKSRSKLQTSTCRARASQGQRAVEQHNIPAVPSAKNSKCGSREKFSGCADSS